MKIVKTYVTTDDGKIAKVDTIEHDNKQWLVPRWLDTTDGKWTMPARIIRLDTLDYQPFAEDFVLNDSVPRVLLDARTPKQPVAGFEVHELPDIRIPRATRLN